jgi:tetratricopeptide (TPR) repeat protein
MEEIQAFMDGLIGKPLPSVPNEKLSKEEQATDLVYDAFNLPVEKAYANILKALDLDPDCIDAFEWLGIAEEQPTIATAFFEKGSSIGRKKFGGEFMKLHKGHFWAAHETRSFMRCLFAHAECMYGIGKVRECVDVLEEIVKLNKNDNQGARDQLMLYLIQLDERDKYLKYHKRYNDGITAFSHFNYALFLFRTEGASDTANTALQEAMKANPHVAAKLLSPRHDLDIPQSYGIGDANEARYYAFYAYPVWRGIEGAVSWLKGMSKRSAM